MKLIFLSLMLLALGCASKNVSHCASRLRGVIDMGSGATKLTMGEVEICAAGRPRLKNKINLDESRAVALEAGKNKAGEIAPEARAKAIAALGELREVARAQARLLGYKDFDLAVVGTHAFRTCANRDEFVKEIEAAGFSIRALSQNEEAWAGFAAVLASPLPPNCQKENVLVWDVGGGSTQLTRYDDNKPTLVKFGLGAENFSREAIPLRSKNKDAAQCRWTGPTPNPLGKNLSTVRARVAKVAPVGPAELKSEGACVVGVGGVHNKAVAAQLRKNWDKIAPCACDQPGDCLAPVESYSKKQVQCLAEFLATKTSCAPEITGPYADTAVTNLAMVLGFMDQLRIERVHTMAINMGDFYVLDGERLKFRFERAK